MAANVWLGSNKCARASHVQQRNESQENEHGNQLAGQLATWPWGNYSRCQQGGEKQGEKERKADQDCCPYEPEEHGLH